MQNRVIWGTLGFVFGRQVDKDDHSGLNGVTTHENGLFLYKTKEVQWAGTERFADYVALGLMGGFFVGN